MARRSEENEFHLLPPEELPEALRTYFYERYKLEMAIAAQIERHVKQLKDDLGALIRKAKAESNINRKVLDGRYAEFKLFQESKNFKEEKEGERLRDQIRRAALALQPGQTLDWVNWLYGEVDNTAADKEKVADGVTKPDVARPEVGATATEQGSESAGSAGPAPLTTKTTDAAAEKKPEPVAGPDNSWRTAPNAKDPGTMSEAEKAGFDFQSGEKAALAGADRKQAFKATGFHARSIRGRNWNAGYDAGEKTREKQLAEATGGENGDALNHEDHASAAATEAVSADDAPPEPAADPEPAETNVEPDDDRAQLPDNVVQLGLGGAAGAAVAVALG